MNPSTNGASSNFNKNNNVDKKKKIIFVLGATATGKSKLAVHLATHFQGEVINSDKIQVYKGLDIITNKISEPDCHGVPHHLIGFVDPEADFEVADFCNHTLRAIHQITEKGKIPIIVGGSNRYIEGFVEDPTLEIRSKFDCLFLWTDVALPVLYEYVGKRVDQMVEAGLVDEVREFFDPEAGYTRGVRRAIGAPELDKFLKAEKDSSVDEATKKMLLDAAIEETKVNTCRLVDSQLGKIHRLRNERGWVLHRIDSTIVFQRSGKEARETWKEVVLGPSLAIVRKFINKNVEIIGQEIEHLAKTMGYFVSGSASAYHEVSI